MKNNPVSLGKSELSLKPKMNAEKLISNFYVRNLFGCLILWAYGRLILAEYYPGASSRMTLFNDLYALYIFLWMFLHNKILVEMLLLKKRILLYIFSLPAGLALWMMVAKYIAINFSETDNNAFNKYIEFAHFVLYTVLAAGFYFAIKYLKEKRAHYHLSILKRDVELQQLKSQLNPHFLFNALNNIYSYTLYSNKFGNELILKLGELMRFILESSEKDSISLKEEIKFIENYIAFERERLGERCLINYSKKIAHEDCRIAPLILFPFVENAFKHGTDTIQKTTVDIQLSDTTGVLKLVVKNNILNKEKASTKKGLPNAARRLELLYPQKHELGIDHANGYFIVNLTLDYAED